MEKLGNSLCFHFMKSRKLSCKKWLQSYLGFEIEGFHCMDKFRVK